MCLLASHAYLLRNGEYTKKGSQQQGKRGDQHERRLDEIKVSWVKQLAPVFIAGGGKKRYKGKKRGANCSNESSSSGAGDQKRKTNKYHQQSAREGGS